MAMIYDSINAYCIDLKKLKEYLESLFPKQKDYIEVKKKRYSNELTLRLPRYLDDGERNHIDDEVRYDPPEY